MSDEKTAVAVNTEGNGTDKAETPKVEATKAVAPKTAAKSKRRKQSGPPMGFRVFRMGRPGKCRKCGNDSPIIYKSVFNPGNVIEYFIGCSNPECRYTNVGRRSTDVEKSVRDWNSNQQ